jgi:GMP synthase (glutamine-hydrolysing)
VTHTVQGARVLARFVIDICECAPDWVMSDYVAEASEKVKTQVGSEEVILGLSGGVDSAVAAALIHNAISDRLTCIFVDTGLLRLGEGDKVMETLNRHLDVKVIRINAGPRFLEALEGCADPEAKRKIIGREFVHVFQEEAAKLPNAKWLAQGSNRPAKSSSRRMSRCVRVSRPIQSLTRAGCIYRTHRGWASACSSEPGGGARSWSLLCQSSGG